MEQAGVAAQWFNTKHPRALRGGQKQKLDLEGKAAQCAAARAVLPMGGANEHTAIELYILQFFIDLSHLIGVLRQALRSTLCISTSLVFCGRLDHLKWQ